MTFCKIAKNVAFLAENAQSLPKSWFPDDFVLLLTQILRIHMEGGESEGFSAEKKHLLFNQVFRIVYYALRRRGGNLRLPDFPILLHALTDTLASNGPLPSVGAILLGFRLLSERLCMLNGDSA